MFHHGIDTIQKLSSCTEKEILKIHGIGKASIPIFKKSVEKQGLPFKQNEESKTMIKKNVLPNLNHKEADIILLSEWTGEESDLIKSINVSMDEVESSEWPDGLISYSCFLSIDKQRGLHCVQWKSPEHHLKYVENHLPERHEHLQGKIAVESEKLFGRFKLKESRLDKTNFTPEYIYLSLNNKPPELKKKTNHISEYLLKNIDNGKLIYYTELKGLNDIILSKKETNIYSLFRSYVQK